MFLLGARGTGKSTCTKSTMGMLQGILGENWTDIVHQGTPTGCASFQMSSYGMTVQIIYSTYKRSTTIRNQKLMDKFTEGLCLLVIDEFSMVFRFLMVICFKTFTNGTVVF